MCLLMIAFAEADVIDQKPRLDGERLRELLNDENSELAQLAKQFIGGGDTNRLFYFPTKDEPATPEKWGFKYEDVTFKSADGTELHGWFLNARADKPKGTVVFSHGNAGSIGHHLGFVMWFVEAGYQVFMYDYRGFGKSGGKVNREGMVNDVKAAFEYVRSRPDVDEEKLVSYGHSLGGAKSVTAIAEDRPEGLRAIIIDGTFASYRDMAKRVGGEFGASMISDELSPKDFIPLIKKMPLLVVHGEKDEVVPFNQGKQLFDLANEPKTLFEVKGGGHGNSLSRDAGAYRKQVLQWLEKVI